MPNPDPTERPAPDRARDVLWNELLDAGLPQALRQGAMLQQLQQVEREILPLLLRPHDWKSVDVNYHPPRVERVYLQHGDLRISLHCIHPCSRQEALFHPHPWPSAMKIISGIYEMAVGYGSGEENPPVNSTIILPPSSSYEMADPNSWHYVRPLGGPAMTLMITGKPWNRSAPKSSTKLAELSDTRKLEIIEFFRSHYSTA